MSRFATRTLALLAVTLFAAATFVAAESDSGTRTFRASPGGKLELDLDAGGTVQVTGDGGSSINVSYRVSGSGEPTIAFDETADGLKITTKFRVRNTHNSSGIDLEIQVPSHYDIELDSMGGGLHVDGVDGTFSGKTMGGELILRNVRGEARLKTMGGEIEVTDAELDGSVETMGGEVTLRRVTGDLNGSSMGGAVRYIEVQRRDGRVGGPKQIDMDDLDGVTEETVQISTMGGEIDVDEAPAGVAAHTMGGDIDIESAEQFAKVTTMGGDIEIRAIDGWVKATTMGGDVDVRVVGSGGDVELTSMSGNITLIVPPGFGMDLDLEIAFTRDSGRDMTYKIETDFDVKQSVTPEWDYDHGSPRRYIRAKGPINGGGNKVKVRTINGDVKVTQGGRVL